MPKFPRGSTEWRTAVYSHGKLVGSWPRRDQEQAELAAIRWRTELDAGRHVQGWNEPDPTIQVESRTWSPWEVVPDA